MIVIERKPFAAAHIPDFPFQPVTSNSAPIYRHAIASPGPPSMDMNDEGNDGRQSEDITFSNRVKGAKKGDEGNTSSTIRIFIGRS